MAKLPANFYPFYPVILPRLEISQNVNNLDPSFSGQVTFHPSDARKLTRKWTSWYSFRSVLLSVCLTGYADVLTLAVTFDLYMVRYSHLVNILRVKQTSMLTTLWPWPCVHRWPHQGSLCVLFVRNWKRRQGSYSSDSCRCSGYFQNWKETSKLQKWQL